MSMRFDAVYNYLHGDRLEGDILEIGADRGDGSTFLFASIAKNLNCNFYSVDVDPNVIARNKDRIKTLPFELPVQFFLQRGEDFLEQHTDKKFSIVLLDNFDWQWNLDNPENFIQEQKDRYSSEFQIEMTNLNSQITHLKQAILVAPLLTQRAIIICDDTYWDHEHATYTGKCGAAVPFFLTLGFELVLVENHGVILVRE